jgi:hypothetical protein
MSWRVGGKVPLNVYEVTGDRPDGKAMFQCHTPEDATRIVDLLNDAEKLHELVRTLVTAPAQQDKYNL